MEWMCKQGQAADFKTLGALDLPHVAQQGLQAGWLVISSQSLALGHNFEDQIWPEEADLHQRLCLLKPFTIHLSFLATHGVTETKA